MSDKTHSNTFLQELVGGAIVVAGINYALVQYGYEPKAYCWGQGVVETLGINAWYHALGFMVALVAIGIGCTKGFTHSIKWLVLLAFLCILPEWLDKGLRLGQTCTASMEMHPPATVKPPPVEVMAYRPREFSL